jgi:hypothetical protein
VADAARPTTEAQASPTEAKPRRLGKRVASVRPAQRCVSFAELVQMHQLRQAALARGEIYEGEAEERYREFERAFQREHGRIINAYWCNSRLSAAALTEKPGRSGPTVSFHRVSDWATKDEPEIAACLHECDELAVKASQVLKGKALPISMNLVMASASHLLSLVDESSRHDSKTNKERALRNERRKLEQTRAYYHQAANGQAQLFYFVGMMLGATVLALAALLVGTTVDLSGINNREFFGSLIAGALGAIVSVMSRIGSGRFRLRYDIGRRYPIFLGSMRPVIGVVFALAFYFAVTSSLLDLFKLPTDENRRFYFLLVIAFLAGFSERWARDTLLAFGGRDHATERDSDKEPPSTATD